jgi:hypothetical protein
VDRKLTELYPEFCSSFGPLLRISFQGVGLRNPPPPSCTIDRVVRNVQAFAQRFESGGWIAYSASLDPSSDLFGAAFEASNILSLEAAREREAAKSSGVAAKGFLSTKKCVEYAEKTVDNDGFYVRGPCIRWMDTTPGGIIERITEDSFFAPLTRIVNARDLAALAAALIQSGLSKLVNLAKDSVSGGIIALDPTTTIDASQAVSVCNDISDPQARQECIDQITRGIGLVPSSTSPGGSGTFQGQVNAAVNACGGAHGVPDSCSPPWRINAGEGPAFVQCVAANLNGAGLTAIVDPNASEGDEIAVKQDNSFSENYDVLVGSGSGGGCARSAFMGRDTPAWF